MQTTSRCGQPLARMEKQDALQTAVTAIQQYLQQGQLFLSAAKSELVLVNKTARTRRKTTARDEIQIFLEDGTQIPNGPRARILGLQLQEDGKATYTLTQLQNQVTQILRIMHRIASRRHGLKEEDTIKLVNALVVSRLVYSTPYLNLTKGEEDKLDALIRRAYKSALGLPLYTSTEKLLKLGVHNTFRELTDAHLAAQRNRLATTPTGREVMRKLRIPYQRDREDTIANIPTRLRSHIKVHAIPRNMDPTLNAARRRARAKYYQDKLGGKVNVLYTDAAAYSHPLQAMAASVVDGQGRTHTTATLRTTNATIAEEMAIALALGHGGKNITILSDSQAAIRRFQAGRISAHALKIIAHNTELQEAELIWIPGHDVVEGNRCAHTVARACIHQAAPNPSSSLDIEFQFIPVPNMYSEIRAYHRGQRRAYPPPAPQLNREESVAWRRLQTGTFRNLALLAKFSPANYKPTCPYCNQYANLIHTTWLCQANPKLPPTYPEPSLANWEAVLLSTSAEDQKKLIDRAMKAADSAGALD